MKSTFKEFTVEGTINKPIKRYPLPKMLSLETAMEFIEKKYKMKLDFNDWVHEKMYKFVFFPKMTLVKVHPEESYKYKNLVCKNEAFPLPKHYDSKMDFADNIEKRILHINKLREILGEEKFKEIEDKIDTYVEYGESDFGYVNVILDLMYKEFSEYYEGDHVDVFTNWEDPMKKLYDYPYPPTIFYSDLVKYINYKYGITDKQFYEWILDNNYIEGRYWETILSLRVKDGKFDRKTPWSKYSRKSPTNVDNILTIIEKDFDLKNDFNMEEYTTKNEFYIGIYMDIYKKIKWNEDTFRPIY